MKKLLTLLVALCVTLMLDAQTTKTMAWGDTTRQYLEYVPSSYNAATPSPVLFVFHGLGDDMNNMFTATGFKQIADAHGWIVITPQALNANISFMGYSYSVGTAWNAGVSASILGQNFILNDGVDDSGWMMAILDDLIAHYNVDQNNVFCTGFSMGGFMTNRMALEHADRINAIASVSGTIGNQVQSVTPGATVNTMHIHGTADATVGYAEASFSVGTLSTTIGLGAEATVDFWRNFNQCSATPVVTNYPDVANDSLTFEQYLYTDGTNGSRTAFIKVNGGDHQWYATPTNDIDYTTEIYNFFAGCLIPTSIQETASQQVAIYPNPTAGALHIKMTEPATRISVYDLTGRCALSVSGAQQTVTDLNVSNLKAGMYVLRIQNANGIQQISFVKE